MPSTMPARPRRLLLLFLVISSMQLVLCSPECEKLGFTGLQACSDCESMAEYVKDQELVQDCKKCCVKDQQGDIKYNSAKLEVCPYKLNGLPHIQDFIDKHASKYKGKLRVVRVIGAYPKIVLSNTDKGQHISVRIDNWKVPTIHEYLKDKLELPAKSR